MDNHELISLTADITTAFLGNQAIDASEVPALIRDTYDALNDLTAATPVIEPLREPAVSIKASVKPEQVTCLECGFKGKMLKRHLMSAHNLSAEEYRSRWGLPANHPLTAPNYAEVRRELAVKIGLGRKPGVKKGRAAK